MNKIVLIQLFLLGISAISRCSPLLGILLQDKICCPDIGCFTKDPPFQYMPLPQCVDDSMVKYTMYTRENPANGEKLSKNSIPSIFKGERRTVFIVHGFIENQVLFQWMTRLKDAHLYREDMNVVTLDWSDLGANLIYPQPASNTRSVGAYTAFIIKKLLQQPNTASSRFWCNGHSLGSHLCGHCGMHMPPDQPLGRATGLDPAGPLFADNPDVTIGINPKSATFVDILHTSVTLGSNRRVGHIDFYPTGYIGGIDLTFNSSFELGIICDPFICAHQRSMDFMIDSLRGTDTCFATDMHCTDENDLPGSCAKDPACVAYMGYRAQESCNKTGIVYLEVPSSPLFCLRQSGAR